VGSRIFWNPSKVSSHSCKSGSQTQVHDDALIGMSLRGGHCGTQSGIDPVPQACVPGGQHLNPCGPTGLCLQSAAVAHRNCFLQEARLDWKSASAIWLQRCAAADGPPSCEQTWVRKLCADWAALTQSP
jgi:hypothetical protein